MKKSNLIAIVGSQSCFLITLPLFYELFNYLNLVVYAVIWFCFTLIAYFLVYLFRKERIAISKNLIIGGMAIYTICLIILLFFRPNNPHYESYNLIPFKTVLFYLSGEVSPLIAVYNLAANIGLFIPYGTSFLLLKKGKPSLPLVIGVSTISISVIEVTQRLTHRGSMDIDDLLLNLLGIGIGYLITPLIQKVVTVE